MTKSMFVAIGSTEQAQSAAEPFGTEICKIATPGMPSIEHWLQYLLEDVLSINSAVVC